MAQTPSNRSVGFTFGIAFAVVGLVPLTGGAPPRVWPLAVCGAFLLLAIAAPRVLGPLAFVWGRIGLAMHRVVNPIVLGALFYLVLTPMGLVMRLFGRGLGRRLDADPTAPTYWIIRDGAFSRMDQQF